MRIVIFALSGLLFGAGLSVSDMIDPSRVLAFLDVGSGAWDPTLIFVMAGAMAPMALAWGISARMRRPVLADAFPARPDPVIDARLVGGGGLFGLGWGLSGFCPGPALSALTVGGPSVWLFVAAMLSGMALARIGDRPRGAAVTS